MRSAREILDGLRGRVLDDAALLAAAGELAAALATEAAATATAQERRRTRMLATLAQDARARAFTTLLTDRAYRSKEPSRVVDACRQLLRVLGIPESLPAAERAKLRALLHAGPFFPETAARGVLTELRKQTASVVWSAAAGELAPRLRERAAEGVRVNLNQLGEAVLGEREASERQAQYISLLAAPEVQAISVKLSSISAQVDVLAYDDTLEALRPRLRAIYAAAGTEKVVSVDMEAYRDLQLTFELITGVLAEPGLRSAKACVVLQAYLPDAFTLQRSLVDWARRRVEAGGVPVRMRLVKGANLSAERVEASMRGWAMPTYATKPEVDANYKRMLDYATQPDHARVVQLGVASHNLFDLALALALRASRQVEPHVGIELLEGMADPLKRLLVALMGDVLVYCPAAPPTAMQSAIAYLMRRLDENTAPQNFLPKSFTMRPGDSDWATEQAVFEAAWRARSALHEDNTRRQPPPITGAGFRNEPDTDYAREAARVSLGEALERTRTAPCFEVPFRIDGERIFHAPIADGFDPSRPGHVPYRFALATDDDVKRALFAAERAQRDAARVSVEERCAWLRQAATGLRRARNDLVAAMVLDAGKRADQADTEVSEAVDFAEYYAESYLEVASRSDLHLQPKGTVVITPPWNFPLAIPAGGVFAALVSGNAVILKPAIETVLVAQRFAEICWSAGIDPQVLQLVTCEDDVGEQLIRDPRVNVVNLTGATATAQLFHRMRPDLDLVAETGGKNALVISALADRDEAIKHLLHSAFGHAGQKCSAASLCICEAEVYDDPGFQRVLADAVESLPVGSAWDLRSVVTPLIRPPSGPLLHATQHLEPGESWLVAPRIDAQNPNLLSPGVKLGVSPGNATHTTELFGPVLGVMRARDIEHAIELVNATPYGLTSGLCSLDEREQTRWAERVNAGNLYINRPITGAVVRRQPFGGYKASSFGGGAKAGGPNYVLNFCNAEPASTHAPVLDSPVPDAADYLARLRRHIARGDHKHLASAACVYAHAFREGFAFARDPSQVLGELNLFRYLPHEALVIRAGRDAILGEALLACLAALTVGARPTLSVDPAVLEGAPWLTGLPLVACVAQGADDCAAQLQPHRTRIRAIGPTEPALHRAAVRVGVHVAAQAIHASGRIELLHYVREQSLSVTYHRNGSLEAKRLLPWAAATE